MGMGFSQLPAKFGVGSHKSHKIRDHKSLFSSILSGKMPGLVSNPSKAPDFCGFLSRWHPLRPRCGDPWRPIHHQQLGESHEDLQRQHEEDGGVVHRGKKDLADAKVWKKMTSTNITRISKRPWLFMFCSTWIGGWTSVSILMENMNKHMVSHRSGGIGACFFGEWQHTRSGIHKGYAVIPTAFRYFLVERKAPCHVVTSWPVLSPARPTVSRRSIWTRRSIIPCDPADVGSWCWKLFQSPILVNTTEDGSCNLWYDMNMTYSDIS